jgi:DNA polymerase-3 subunit epsilon
MNNILLYDTETTGLTLHPDAPVHKQPKMVEFGGLLISRVDGSIIEEIQTMVDPGEPIPAEASKISGIYDKDVEGAPTFIQLLPMFRRVFGSASTVSAHNLPFDKAIVQGELARHSITDFQWPERGVCTVGLFKDHWGRNPRLIELYEWAMGKPLAQTHRALDDVKAMYEIVMKLELWRVM